MSDSILDVFKQDNYRLGSCFIQVYDRKRVDVFGTNYLHHLWSECVRSRPSHPYGILPETFCGMSDTHADAITSYLHTRNPLLLLCIDNPSNPSIFNVAGFSFPTVICGTPQTERSILAGYAYFRPYWGSPEIIVLGMLGLAYLFQELNLQAIHGQRYDHNGLTAQYMEKFGSREVGRIPKFILEDGKLEDCVLSSLLREDFERYVEKQLLTLAGETISNGRQGRGTEHVGPGGRSGRTRKFLGAGPNSASTE